MTTKTTKTTKQPAKRTRKLRADQHTQPTKVQDGKPVPKLHGLAYDQQPGESATAFDAFRHYRDLGPERRLSQVARTLRKSEALLRRWSSHWRWQERVTAWDRKLDTVRQDAAIEGERDRVRKMLTRHAQQAEASMRGLLAPIEALLARIEEAGGVELAFTGVPTIELAELVSRTSRAILNVAKVERMALGLAAETGLLELDDPKNMTRAAKLAKMASMRDEVAARRAMKEGTG